MPPPVETAEADAATESTFDSFLSDIAGVVANQLRELEPRRLRRVSTLPTDADKLVWHWPDVTNRLIEDHR